MKNITKKFFIYVLCALLSVSACSCSYVRSVYALEYVGGALAFEEALKWLLGSIGIVSAGGMTADYWENHGDEFVDYCAEQNITNAEVAEWQMKLCSGVLDKASSCWSAFKAWASGLVSSGSSSGSGSYNSAYNVIGSYALAMGITNFSFNENLQNVDVYAAVSWGNYLELLMSPGFYSYNNYMLCSGSNTFNYYEVYVPNFCNIPNAGATNLGSLRLNSSNGFTAAGEQIFWNVNVINSNYNHRFIDLSAISPSNSDTIGLSGVTTDNLDIIDSDIVDEENPEVSIPLPGLGASDNEVSSDTYDDIVDAINDGTISLDDGIAQIQDLLRVIVYDDTTDEVVPYQPDPDTGDNKTKEEVIQENRNNMGFTLFGLENVFPFCIPWDIFAFLNVLKADPVAPVFNLPFPNVNDLEHPLMVRVDLSGWDDGMAIFRLAEDFLFIVGLAFLTRSLIGAGGDD